MEPRSQRQHFGSYGAHGKRPSGKSERLLQGLYGQLSHGSCLFGRPNHQWRNLVAGQPFPNNTIPQSLLSPNGQAMVNHFYLAPNTVTNPGTAYPYEGGNNFNHTVQQPQQHPHVLCQRGLYHQREESLGGHPFAITSGLRAASMPDGRHFRADRSRLPIGPAAADRWIRRPPSAPPCSMTSRSAPMRTSITLF